jgi:antitoxin ParD1/3/4
LVYEDGVFYLFTCAPWLFLIKNIDYMWDTQYNPNNFHKENMSMAEGVNVRITGKLKRFIEEQAGPDGLYESASEYVRDLIRRDYQQQEERKWRWLIHQLRSGMEADENNFIPFDPEEIIRSAKEEKAGDAT